ncbi:hypothetical protein OG900_02120 [Streptomyces sp. NBC_00433]
MDPAAPGRDPGPGQAGSGATSASPTCRASAAPPTAYETDLYDSAGRHLDCTGLRKLCAIPDPARIDPGKLPSRMGRSHPRTSDTFQPADRIGHFHLVLAACYGGIGVAALAAVWLIVRRTSLSAG